MSTKNRNYETRENQIPKPNQNQEFSEPALQVNGLEQVIEMLRYADPSFRASLLRRIQARDPGLARKLLTILR